MNRTNSPKYKFIVFANQKEECINKYLELYKSGYLKEPFKVSLLNTLLIILAVLTVDFSPDKTNEWVMRAGAIVTIISAYGQIMCISRLSDHRLQWIEIRLLKCEGKTVTRMSGKPVDDSFIKRGENQNSFTTKTVYAVYLFNLIIGTLLWGYGDLIFDLIL